MLRLNISDARVDGSMQGVYVGVLMWLGLLFVLGTALLLSVALGNTLLAIAGSALLFTALPGCGGGRMPKCS